MTLLQGPTLPLQMVVVEPNSAKQDAENRWWVAELLAADYERAWLHPGEEETMQKWYLVGENEKRG